MVSEIFAWFGVLVLGACLFLFLIYKEINDLRKLVEIRNATA